MTLLAIFQTLLSMGSFFFSADVCPFFLCGQIGKTNATFTFRSRHAEGPSRLLVCKILKRGWLTPKPSASKDVSSEFIFTKGCLQYKKLVNTSKYYHLHSFSEICFTIPQELSALDTGRQNSQISIHPHLLIPK